MNGKKTIAKYVKPSSWTTIVGWLLILATLVSLFLGIAASSEDEGKATLFHPIYSETGSYVYLDVVGVSDWLYDYDDNVYYAVEDADGYLYTVKLTKTQFHAMAEQQDYWLRETEDVPMPSPYRLYGVAKKASSDVKENLAYVWDLTETEYEDYFGTLYLNATTTPNSEESSGYFVFGMMCFLFAIVFLVLNVAPNRAFRKCMKRLEELDEVERAAEMLDSPDCVTIGKNRAILSGRYLYGRKTGVVIRYDDILWCYKKIQRYNFVAVNSFLMVNTAKQKELAAINLGKTDKYEEIEQALRFIAEKNPSALIGYNSENRKLYKERRKAAEL